MNVILKHLVDKGYIALKHSAALTGLRRQAEAAGHDPHMWMRGRVNLIFAAPSGSGSRQ